VLPTPLPRRVYFAEVPRLDHSPWHWAGVASYLLINLISPRVYLFLLTHYRRVDPSKRASVLWDRLLLLNTVGLFLFFGFAFAPGWLRMCSVSLPALIVLAWLLSQPGTLRNAARWALAAFALVLMIGGSFATQWQCTDTLRL
jgi:hypothetical protein